MSKDINLVAVCAEKKGRPINRPGQREREPETQREGTMGSHQEESPNSCKAPYPNAHSHAHANVHPLAHIYSPHFSFSLSLPTGPSERGPAKQMFCHWLHKRAQVTGGGKKKKEKGNQLPHFLLHCWVSIQRNSWQALILCSFKSFLTRYIYV